MSIFNQKNGDIGFGHIGTDIAITDISIFYLVINGDMDSTISVYSYFGYIGYTNISRPI
jgi:hypothetical protein